MASETDIANRALTKIGAGRIISLSDDLEAARVINNVWDSVRDGELRAHLWNFAVRRDQLAALVSVPSWRFAYEYQLPSDCLRVLQVGEYFPQPSLTNYRGSDESAWRIEDTKIRTDYGAPLPILYVSRSENTGTWDALFVSAFASRLAFEICERLTDSTSKRELAMREYRDAIRQAVTCNAIENPPQPIADDAWVLARL